jgi:hypothetical protein
MRRFAGKSALGTSALNNHPAKMKENEQTLFPLGEEDNLQPPVTIETTSKTSDLGRKLGAVLMVPDFNEDIPLSHEELKTGYGFPVIVDSINYTSYRDHYLQLVHSSSAELPTELATLPSLKDLAREEARIVRQFDLRLLIAHDSKEYKKHGYTRELDYLRTVLGVEGTRSTIQRRIVHAKVALLFACNGMADKIPSQAQANTIYKLPRPLWVQFWKEALCWGKLSRTGLEQAVDAFASRMQVPVRCKAVPEPKPKLLDAPPPNSHPEPEPEPEPGEAEVSTKFTKKRAGFNLIALSARLTKEMPASFRACYSGDSVKAAKKYQSALKNHVRSPRSPSKTESRMEFYRWIEERHPNFAAQIFKTAVANFFHEIEESLRKGKRFRS